MGLIERAWSMLGVLPASIERKATPEEIRADIAAAATTALSGQVVNLTEALKVSTVLGCVRVLGEGVAQVPCKLYRRDAKGGRAEARDNPLFELLHRRPNPVQTSFEFRETMIMHAALTGNAFVFINRSSTGEILELLPYDPGAVTVTRWPDGTLSYKIRLERGQQVPVPADRIWHFRGPSWNAWEGLNLLSLARNAVGLKMATEEFGSALFKNGARPGGALVAPGDATPDSLIKIRDQWNASMSGSGNAMKTAVLLGGLKFEKLSYSSEDAQYNDTAKAAAREICAFFRVNPIMVQLHDQAAAYASVEQMFLAHVVHTLMPWYERIEQSAELALLTSAERKSGLYIKLEAKALMRGTAKERAEFHQILLQNAVVSRNEVRIAEDMDRIDDPEFDVPHPAANLYGPKPAQGQG
jgi:HK97 family phage portal protein